MAARTREVAGALVGAVAGLGVALPTPACLGGACASCLACVGVGAAVAPVLLLSIVVARRIRADTGDRDDGVAPPGRR
jgi:hypothetical protein